MKELNVYLMKNMVQNNLDKEKKSAQAYYDSLKLKSSPFMCNFNVNNNEV